MSPLDLHRQRIDLIAYAWYARRTLCPELAIYRLWFMDEVLAVMRDRGWLRD